MPRVAFIDLDFNGKPRRFEAWFSEKDRFYIKGLEPEIRDALSSEKVHNEGTDREERFKGEGWPGKVETLDQLRELLLDAVDEYHRLNVSARKIIVYRMGVTQRLGMVKDESAEAWNKWRAKPWAKKAIAQTGMYSSPEDGLGFEIQWTVCYEVKKGDTEYRDVYQPEDGSGERPGMFVRKPPGDVMDWTPEREQFFRGIDAQIEALAIKVAAFFDMQPEEITKGIDGGSLKLLGS